MDSMESTKSVEKSANYIEYQYLKDVFQNFPM